MTNDVDQDYIDEAKDELAFYVEEAKNRYDNRAEEIEQEIAELKSELEETQNNRDSYNRFLEQET